MLEKGIFQFDEIKITPDMDSSVLENCGLFQIVKLKTATIYLTQVKKNDVLWDLRITTRQSVIQSLELRIICGTSTHNALSEKYAMHNKFLEAQLGAGREEGLGRTEYSFKWGCVCSYMDIKTGECVILVEYL